MRDAVWPPKSNKRSRRNSLLVSASPSRMTGTPCRRFPQHGRISLCENGRSSFSRGSVCTQKFHGSAEHGRRHDQTRFQDSSFIGSWRSNISVTFQIRPSKWHCSPTAFRPQEEDVGVGLFRMKIDTHGENAELAKAGLAGSADSWTDESVEADMSRRRVSGPSGDRKLLLFWKIWIHIRIQRWVALRQRGGRRLRSRTSLIKKTTMLDVSWWVAPRTCNV